MEETNHRVPVYAGSGCITTKETIALSKKAFEIGADALSIVTPFYAAASQEELYAHYMDVASAVDMPIVMYNIPPRTGNALAPATVRRLAQSAPNIVGVKDSSGNFDNMKQYIEQTATLDREFSVLSGNDSLILPALVFGGKGGIAGCANVFPRAMVKIYETWAAGDLESAGRYPALPQLLQIREPQHHHQAGHKRTGVSGRELQKAVLPVVRRGHGADEGCSAGMCQQRNVLKT